MALLFILACQPSEEGSGAEADEYAAMIFPSDNPSSTAGIALGRQLFFDPILSADSTISCASCHKPELAFSDGLAVSRGIAQRPGSRNTPGLTNVGYLHQSMFWDGRADNLEQQALHPIATAHEMGGDWPSVIARLRHSDAYARRFLEVFDLGTIRELNPDHVGRALAQYQRALVSRDSKYDRVRRGEAGYTAQEALGHALFFDFGDDPTGDYAGLPTAECAHCHTPPHFTNQRFENNGLDSAASLEDFTDKGRGAINQQRYDNGKFRNPGLRNVALTAPYMHDGRFSTLTEVIDHYNSGGHYAENRSPNVHPLGLSPDQRAALVAFLHTLTDTSFVKREQLGGGAQVQ